jgi:hypothetical protein
MFPLHLMLTALVRWIAGEQQEVIEYLRAENLVLKAQPRGRRVRLSDAERRRLALLGARLGHPILTEVATIVRPDTLLRWHRELIVRKRTNPKRRPGRPAVHTEIRGLVVRMATENPSWGYTRIQGALKNLGHRVARTTVANILKEQGIPPSGRRPMSWRTFLRTHLDAMFGADRVASAFWTLRRCVTYHTVCVITLCSRRVQRMASPLYPHEQVASQVVPQLADGVRPELVGARVRICDRDRSWSTAVQHRLHAPVVPRIRAPVVAPNCDAHAPRFVPSSQEGCVKRVVSLGEGYDRPTLAAFVTPHHRERNRQGPGNVLPDHPRPTVRCSGLPSARGLAATGLARGTSFWTLRVSPA